MDNQAYYRIYNDTGCDMALDDRYIVVNCSGVCVLSEPFTSKNSRSDYYLMYLYQGELEMDIDGQTQIVPAGSLIIYPPKSEYRYTKRSRDGLIYYWAHFTGFGTQAMLNSCELDVLTVYYVGLSSDIADSFRHLCQNFICSDHCSEVAAAAQLTTICVQLKREITRNAPVDLSNMMGKIGKSLIYIHKNYSSPISIATLADIEHISVSRYCTIFKQYMGVSPQNFMIDLRLKMAIELMLGTDLSLKQIAKTVGYDDQLYFSRLFKFRKGVSPKFYANRAFTVNS